MTALPFNGQIIPAHKKKYNETIVFVPFYRGNRLILQRHIEMVKELGFNSLYFDLKSDLEGLGDLPISSNLKWGIKHIWADQVESILNACQGPKIIYTFSYPASAAIEAIARRHANDIKALICDSGPSAQLYKPVYNLFKYEIPTPFTPLRFLRSAVSSFMLSPFWSEELKKDLSSFPPNFPVLSIRGWRDKIISPEWIDQVFEPHNQLAWQRLSLPKADHLNGLKDFREDYVAGVKQFLLALNL